MRAGSGSPQRCFTLIEVVVVMFVLALASAVVVPAGGAAVAAFTVGETGLVQVTPAEGAAHVATGGTLDAETGVLTLHWTTLPPADTEVALKLTPCTARSGNSCCCCVVTVIAW